MSKSKQNTRTFFLNGKVHKDITMDEYQAIVSPKKEVAKPKKEETKAK